MSEYPNIPLDEFEEFVNVVRRLRKDCPWDREQTHQSIRHSLVEECYEVVEALDENNLRELPRELGDLLLHIVMHATIAEQAKEFSLHDILRHITDKLVRRHPHVFGALETSDVNEVKHNWEKLKMAEGRSSVLEGIPKHLPSLQRAGRVQERAAKVGFDWNDKDDVWLKIKEEAEEFRQALASGDKNNAEEEFGDYLFALVNYARFENINPENALRSTVEKFIRRFQFVEDGIRKQGKDIHTSSLQEMDMLWNSAKEKGY